MQARSTPEKPEADGPAIEAGRRPIVKMSYAVGDARLAAAQWAVKLGAGPFFVKSHIPLTDFSTLDTVLDHTSAFGQWGPIMVELMQIHAVSPPSVAEFLVRPGLHHVTWFAESLAAESERLEHMGWPLLLIGATTTGTTFAFHDARSDLGHLIQIYERTIAVRKNYANVKHASENWDGMDPVRET